MTGQKQQIYLMNEPLVVNRRNKAARWTSDRYQPLTPITHISSIEIQLWAYKNISYAQPKKL